VLVFGLTGGLASGKSTVAAHLRARGVPVIDADLVAREVVAPGTPGLAAVVDAFGADVLAADGSLDRAKMAQRVFSDEDARRRLNSIVHPLIGAATAARVAELAARGELIVCYEAALLVENGLADAFRPLVVVAVDEATQVARAMARDGATEAQARARIAAQLPLAAKVAAADYVIDTSASKEDTSRRVDEVLAELARALPLPVP
jgi:dephospho-CoA kinase